MLLPAIIIVPFAAGVLALLIRADGPRRALLVVAAGLHLALSLFAATHDVPPAWGGLLIFDALGRLFLCLASILFSASAVYALGYLRAEEAGPRPDFVEGTLFVNAPEARFTACLLFFLAAMSLVCTTRHLGLLWVGVEATTLASAPLIYFHRQRRSLEATWKYLMICSVGIALALFGNILLTAAVGGEAGGVQSMNVADLVRRAADIREPWFQAAFICILVGYGTKMGLAPMHTWLPDAHSEAPSIVSALLSGALLNCAFLGILRVVEVGAAAGQAAFAMDLLVLFGLLSMTLAAVFIVGQGDFKRLLAYSSVEHMGLLALGVGLGGGAVFGAMLHAVNHSLAKAGLFLLAGNILAAFHTKSAHDVRGVVRVMPVTGVFWLAGFLAITGTPPFGLFVSEFAIVRQAMLGGRYLVAGLMLASLAAIFAGFSIAVLRMAQGTPPPSFRRPPGGERLTSIVSPVVLCAATAVLGVYIPSSLTRFLVEAARATGLPLGGLP